MMTAMTPSRARSVTRPLALVGLAVAVLLSLAGCVKLDMSLTFAADDTVDGTIVFAIEKSVLEMTGQTVDEFLDSTEDSLGDDATSVEPYQDDTFVGRTYTFVDQPLSEFGDEDMTVTHEDGTFTVDGTLDLGGAPRTRRRRS